MPTDEINFTNGPSLLPGGAALVADPGYVLAKWITDAAYPDPNNPTKSVRDLVPEVPNPGASALGAQSIATIVELNLAPGAPGNFTVAHGLGTTPKFAIIQMTSGGQIWLQSPTSFDATNLYLAASDASATAIAAVWASAADAEIALAPSAPGAFSVPHGLAQTPALVLVEMTSGGQVWFQATPWDGTIIYLEASDAGVTGKAEVWLNVPILNISSFKKIALAPSAPGNFTVAHGLGKIPTLAIVRMSSGGQIWLQSPTSFDVTNLYLEASDAGITGEAEVWAVPTLPKPVEIALAPSAPGNFTVAHGLGSTPKVVLIQMTSGGQIWFQTARYDSINLYLVASDAGLTGYAEMWT